MLASLYQPLTNEIVGVVFSQVDDGAFSEQSVKQVLQSAKENLKWSLLKT